MRAIHSPQQCTLLLSFLPVPIYPCSTIVLLCIRYQSEPYIVPYLATTIISRACAVFFCFAARGKGPRSGTGDVGGAGGGTGGGNNPTFPAGFAQPLQPSENAPSLGLADDPKEEEFAYSREGREGRGGAVVPPCYSSPDADPSEGAWRKTKGGVSASPATGGGWDFPNAQFDFLNA